MILREIRKARHVGEYAEYRIGPLGIYCLKNDFAARPFLMEVFSPNDFIDFPEQSDDDPGFYGYRTTVKSSKERLDVLGYTYERSVQEVQRCVEERIVVLNSEQEGEASELIDCDDDGNEVDWKALDEVVHNPEALDEALRQVFSNLETTSAVQASQWSEEEIEAHPVNAFAGRFIGKRCVDPLLAIPTDPIPDERCLLRLFLEHANDSVTVEYDCTLPARYWDSSIPAIMDDYLKKSVFSPSSQVILLTEGPTDDEFIRDAFKLLRPSISHLFRFFDHQLTAPDRSSSALEKLSKSIISLSLQERFIFLFDNDAAGIGSMNKLPPILPPNMAAIHLPDITIANSYPAFGPDGMTNSDLNGRAVAIEFFLGERALKRDDGTQKAIVWKGLENKVYQGGFEKDDKKHAQEVYRSAVARAQTSGVNAIHYDWSLMEMLIDYIVETAKTLVPRELTK